MPHMEVAQTTFPTRHDLPPEDRESIVDLLNQQLAGTLDLCSRAKRVHWNAPGMGFFQLHFLEAHLQSPA